MTVALVIYGGILGLMALNYSGALLSMLGLGDIHQSFDMITMLGFVILLGTEVTNPILIVGKARAQFAKSNAVIDSVKLAVKSRLRPIMLLIKTVTGSIAQVNSQGRALSCATQPALKQASPHTDCLCHRFFAG